MPKQSKQIIIDAIIKEIEGGGTRAHVLGKIGKKWGISRTTFDRHWKMANEQHLVKQRAIKSKLAIIDEQAAIEARKRAIMDAEDRQEELSKACLDLIQKIKGEKRFTFFQGGKIVQSHNGETFMLPVDTQIKILDTVKGLIAELNKMGGNYAATKVAATNTAGEDVAPMIVLNQYMGAAIEIRESE